MVGYQLNLATNSKMIDKSKGSILLISNLLNFVWGTHIFFKSRLLDILSMLHFVILPFVWGPLSFECVVDRLFMFNQRLIGLLMLWLRDPSILVEDLLHFGWGPLPFDQTENYLCFIISVCLVIFMLIIQMC